MARYLGPTLKKCRRYGGVNLETKSDVRALDTKCKLTQPPGQHGATKSGRLSDFGEHFHEKQKMRFIFGVTERQFRRYFAEAARRKGATGSNLVTLLEARLDNVVYRMGFATTRAEARQIVSHGLVMVNGKKVNIPSYSVAVGDKIEIREKAKQYTRITDAMQIAQGRGIADWLSVDPTKVLGTLVRNPDRSEVFPEINDKLIVELYSR